MVIYPEIHVSFIHNMNKRRVVVVLQVAHERNTPNSKMTVPQDDLGRATWKRGIEGQVKQ